MPHLLNAGQRPSSLVLLFLLSVMPGCGISDSSSNPSGLPELKDLTEGWNHIFPKAETMCSYGSEYSFYARPGNLDKLAILLEGGGACWFGGNCDPKLSPTYDRKIGPGDDASKFKGLLAMNDPRNPIRDYSVVWIPYCTGDVYTGNSRVKYDTPATDSTTASSTTVNHRGYVNATAVLDWTMSVFSSPKEVFITGSSAGGIGSPFHAARLVEEYPDAQLVVIGAAAGAYRVDHPEQFFGPWRTVDSLPNWPEYAGIMAENLTFNTFYTALGTHAPGVIMGQINSADDHVQKGFLALLGISGHQPERLKANLDDIRNAVPNFSAFTIGGDEHGIIFNHKFYERAANGIRLSDWVTEMVNGTLAPDVTCIDCQQPEIIRGNKR